MINEELLWSDSIRFLTELPPDQKKFLSQNLELEISALCKEFIQAQKNHDKLKKQRVIKRFKWVNQRLCDISQDVKYNLTLSDNDLSFPHRKIHPLFLLKCLTIALSVAYCVLKNYFWRLN